MKGPKKQKQHYVDNKELLAAVIRYKENVAIAEIQGKPKPKVSEYIGSCFLKIATHLSYRPNFINYMYKDDMICDGIENCCLLYTSPSPRDRTRSRMPSSA